MLREVCSASMEMYLLDSTKPLVKEDGIEVLLMGRLTDGAPKLPYEAEEKMSMKAIL